MVYSDCIYDKIDLIVFLGCERLPWWEICNRSQGLYLQNALYDLQDTPSVGIGEQHLYCGSKYSADRTNRGGGYLGQAAPLQMLLLACLLQKR